jgi:hypothetical protein
MKEINTADEAVYQAFPVGKDGAFPGHRLALALGPFLDQLHLPGVGFPLLLFDSFAAMVRYDNTLPS